MLRVAILSPSAELGGAERSLLTFLKIAQNRLLEAMVILPRRGLICPRLDLLGVPWNILEPPPALLRLSRTFRIRTIPDFLRLPLVGPGYLRKIKAALHSYAPDVIYSNGIKGHILSALLRGRLQVGTVWHVRDHWGGALAGRLADWGTDLIIANSKATASRLQVSMRRPEKVHVVHCAVDTKEFSPNGYVAETTGIPDGFLRIGLPGPLTAIKGHKIFLQAAERIRKEYPKVHFFFIGGGIYDTSVDRGYERELRAVLDRSDVAGHVSITGFQEEMAPWYRAMDMVVNASVRPEGFGRTLLEAMACGRAVVGPKAGGIPEFLRHEENGLLYEMGKADDLAQCLLFLIGDENSRKRLGKAGRETARRNSSEVSHAEAISRILYDAARLSQNRIAEPTASELSNRQRRSTVILPKVER